LAELFFSIVDTDVDDAAQPKSKSSKRVANPHSDDDLGDRVVDDCNRVNSDVNWLSKIQLAVETDGSDKLSSTNLLLLTKHY
jgi:hypothetical protein